MATVITDDKHYAAIAAKIREKGGQAHMNSTFKPEEMPSGIDGVYQEGLNEGTETGYKNGYDYGKIEEAIARDEQEAAYLADINVAIADFGAPVAETLSDVPAAIDGVYSVGKKSGYAVGVTDGAQSEYDRFWDVFQKNGRAEGVNYYHAFCYGDRFTDDNYEPKYDIICSATSTGGRQLFYSNSRITSTKVPIRVLGSSVNSIFYGCVGLREVPLFEIHSGVDLTSAFANCTSLESITFTGTIGRSIDIHWSTNLTKDSITSIFNALSSTTSGLSVTFSETALIKAFGNSSSEEWIALRDSKPNWTIAYV